MKKVLVIIGIVILVAGAYFVLKNTLAPKNITNYPSRGTNIIAFGDSLIAGVGSTEGSDFVSLLSRRLGQPIQNLGKSGDTTITALTRLNEVLANDPKIVLILLGGNDYLGKIDKTVTFQNLGMMIEAIQNDGAIVVVLGVRGGLLKDNYESDYKELAQKYGAAYVSNVLANLIGRSDLMSDTIHPNDNGYKIIADKVYPVLVKLID